MSNKRSDLIVGIVLALFAVWYYYEASNIKLMKLFADATVNSRTLPKFWAICLLLLAFCLVVRGIRVTKAHKSEDKFSLVNFFKTNAEVFLTFLSLFIFILLIEPVGFIISSMIYIFVQTLILTKDKTKSTVLKAMLLAVVCSTSFYFVFVKWFAVLLPKGAIFE